MAKQTKFEGQLPLIGQVESKETQVESKETNNVREIPLTFGSPIQALYLEQALMNIVPADKKSDEVISVVHGIQSALVAVTNSTRDLAVGVYAFCTLTGCTYAEVDKAFHKGTQKQLSKGYISKLYHAGHALSVNPVAYKILDIGKLSELGRLSDDLIKSSLVEQEGQAMINGQFATLLDRNKFIDELRAVSPDTFKAKESTWNAKSLISAVQNAIKSNPKDQELIDASKAYLVVLEARAKAQDEAKKSNSEKSEAAAETPEAIAV